MGNEIWPPREKERAESTGVADRNSATLGIDVVAPTEREHRTRLRLDQLAEFTEPSVSEQVVVADPRVVVLESARRDASIDRFRDAGFGVIDEHGTEFCGELACRDG